MGELTPIAAVMVRQMLFLDPPRTAGCAAWRRSPSRPGASRICASHIQEIAEALIDDLAGDGRFDVMDALANPLPAIVTAEMLGVPTADHELLKTWSQDFAEMLGNFQHNPGRARKSSRRSRRWSPTSTRAVRQRGVAAPTEGLINALVTAEVDGDRLTEEEVVANVIVTMVGGQETTTNLIGNGLLTLLRQPDAARAPARRSDARAERGRGAAALREPQPAHRPPRARRRRARRHRRSPRATR